MIKSNVTKFILDARTETLDKEKEANDKLKQSISSEDSNTASEEKLEAISSAATTSSLTKPLDTTARRSITAGTVNDLPCSEPTSSTTSPAVPSATSTVTSLITSTNTTMSLPPITTATIADIKPNVDAKASADVKSEKVESTKLVVHSQASSNNQSVKGAKIAAPKDQEIMSTIANIKKESNVPVPPVSVAPTESSTDYSAKNTSSMFIKKEPGDESTDNSNSNSNTSSNNSGAATNNEPHDMKLANDIKTESKCGLDLSESKHEDSARSAFEPHIKFNPVNKVVDPHMKFNSEMDKHNEPMKFGHDLPMAAKYPPTSIDPSQKYDIKPFSDSAHKFASENEDRKASAENAHSDGMPPLGKGYPPIDDKYPPMDGQPMKYPPHMADAMKYEGPENMAMKRPPYSEPHQNIRSPYDVSPMLKYSDALHKFPGAGPLLTPSLPHDLKYTPPADMKYRPPENLSKSQFSADNLMKANMYGAEYPPKYAPAESPIDASARSTPNQDSQSSNSNLPSQLQHNATGNSFSTSLPPQPSLLPHLPPSNTSAVPMLIGPGGLPTTGNLF